MFVEFEILVNILDVEPIIATATTKVTTIPPKKVRNPSPCRTVLPVLLNILALAALVTPLALLLFIFLLLDDSL